MTVVIPSTALPKTLRDIVQKRLTGQISLNYTEGRLAGGIQWRANQRNTGHLTTKPMKVQDVNVK